MFNIQDGPKVTEYLKLVLISKCEVNFEPLCSIFLITVAIIYISNCHYILSDVVQKQTL